ncbi:hypothetical protein [Pseudomonas pseudonitroreducens]|uniref:hypothetical protein n=1 Tax=Pseudomonas pseudonitroreducens TaxID=2892326 RepID=UPI001F37BEB1|nr:hypothetical protein [Pseudomonas pseudonitroreducens]
MTDFRVIEILLDHQSVFIRRETVGSSTIGGEDPIPYQQHVVKAHFINMLAHTNTQMDRAAAAAAVITVRVLCTLTGTKEQADAVKAFEILNARRTGKYQVLNQR